MDTFRESDSSCTWSVRFRLVTSFEESYRELFFGLQATSLAVLAAVSCQTFDWAWLVALALLEFVGTFSVLAGLR